MMMDFLNPTRRWLRLLRQGWVTKNFKRSESRCRCGCGFDTVDVELALVKQDLRDALRVPIFSNSGCRCAKHNKREGGSKDSYHMQGKADDLWSPGVSPSVIADYLEMKYPNRYGIIRYDGFTHFDVRAEAYRDDRRTKNGNRSV